MAFIPDGPTFLFVSLKSGAEGGGREGGETAASSVCSPPPLPPPPPLTVSRDKLTCLTQQSGPTWLAATLQRPLTGPVATAWQYRALFAFRALPTQTASKKRRKKNEKEKTRKTASNLSPFIQSTFAPMRKLRYGSLVYTDRTENVSPQTNGQTYVRSRVSEIRGQVTCIRRVFRNSPDWAGSQPRTRLRSRTCLSSRDRRSTRSSRYTCKQKRFTR